MRTLSKLEVCEEMSKVQHSLLREGRVERTAILQLWSLRNNTARARCFKQPSLRVQPQLCA